MQITLTFNARLEFNTSLQVGDTIWYVSTSSIGDYEVAPKQNIVKLGRLEEMSHDLQQRVLKISNYFPQSLTSGPQVLDTDSFIMFSKDNTANIGGLSGYYAEASLVNNSKEKIELYSIGSEIVESSK